MGTEPGNSFTYWVKIAYRICGNVSDAEDVVQRTCLEMLQKGGDPIEPANGGLMRRVISCRAIDVLRQRKSRPHSALVDDLAVSPQASPERRVQDQECLEVVREGLANLPERQSQVFALRFLSELSIPEIASMLECSENSVSVQLSKAKRNLQQHFEERYGVIRRTT
jgi:RNA polymerase sigma-70 factor, ECF subfamily